MGIYLCRIITATRGYNEARIARIAPGWLEKRNFTEDFSDGRSGWYVFKNNANSGELLPPEDNGSGSVFHLANIS